MVRSTKWVGPCLLVAVMCGCSLPSFSRPASTSGGGKVRRHVSADEKRNAEFFNMRGLEACQDKKYSKALIAFQKAIGLNPNKGIYYNNLGRAQYWLGEYDAALSTLQKSQELSPKDARVRANMGDIHRQRKEYAKAADYYYEALELAGDSLSIQARVNYELGNLYLKQNQFDNAEFRLDRAIQLDPKFHRAFLARLILYHLTLRDRLAWADVLHLEKDGYEVKQELRNAVLKGVKEADEKKRFRPGY